MINNTLSKLFKGDKVIWMVFFFLCIISIVEVFSASSQLAYKGGSYLSPMFKHIFLLILGIFCMIITLNIQCRYFKIALPFLLILSILTLAIVIFAGQTINGGSRWLNIFGLSFQPSEIAKGTMVLATAQIYSVLQTDNGADKNAFKWVMGLSIAILALICGENLSTAALLFLVIVMMMFIGRTPYSQLGKLLGVVTLLGVAVIFFIMAFGKDVNEEKKLLAAHNVTVVGDDKDGLFEKRPWFLKRADTWKTRIDKFMNSKDIPPDSVDLDKDAQVSYANIAIASSNVIGKGPGNSEQRDFLSQAFSDFIYAIIIEEMGIIGAGGVAFLYIILLFRTAKIANQCENNFPAFLAMGLALMLVTQALFNMCVAVGLAPVTGQPLPLISKGGTSTVINCVYIGVILSISRSAKKRTPAANAQPAAV